MMLLQLLIACMCVPYLLDQMLLSISHRSQIAIASYNTVTYDNTVTYFGQHVTSLHFDDTVLVVCMSRSTWPACIMH